MEKITYFESPFQLVNNRITKFNVNNTLYSLDDADLKKEIKDLDYTVDELGDEEDCYIGVLSLSIKVKASRKKKDKSTESLSLSICVQGAFNSPKDKLTKEIFEEMLKVNGTACLYSIARANIISISSQCALEGQMRLPMLNVIEFVKATKGLPDTKETKNN